MVDATKITKIKKIMNVHAYKNEKFSFEFIIAIFHLINILKRLLTYLYFIQSKKFASFKYGNNNFDIFKLISEESELLLKLSTF